MSEIVTISQLQEQSDDTVLSSQLLWDLQLPPSLDLDTIGVNIDRLRLMHRIGGIGCSVIKGYQGDRTEFTPGISGINTDGTAIASRAGVSKKAEEYKQSHIELDDCRIRPPYNQILAIHRVNKAALADTISDKVRSGNSREALWSEQLDKIIRSSVQKSAKDNLVGRPSLPFRLLYAQSLAYDAFAIGYYHRPILNAIYSGSYAAFLGLHSLRNKSLFDDTLIGKRRWSASIFDEYQVDRYIAVKSISLIPGLITNIK